MEWFNPKNKVPPLDTHVLAWDGSYQFIAERFILKGFRRSEDKCYFSSVEPGYGKILYWTYLPAPPASLVEENEMKQVSMRDIINKVWDFFDNHDEKAHTWFNTPNPEISNLTPLEFMVRDKNKCNEWIAKIIEENDRTI